MRILRGIGITLGVLIALVILTAAVGYGISSSRLARSWDVTPESIEFSTDSAVLARGKHLAEARLGCADCHTADLGGQVFIDSPVFGRFVAPNLTRGTGGIAASYTDADWVRSVRHGVAPDGRALMIMPSQEFSRLSRADLVAVISYVRSVPAVDRTVPQSAPGPIARAMVVLDGNAIPASVIDHSAPFAAAPVEEVSVEYGAYLAGTSGCRGCHGPDLGGAKSHEPGGVPPKNLTSAGALGGWSEADFLRAMREGKRPDGTAIDPAMPWRSMGRMSELELKAIFSYLKSLPPVTREL
jgi:mono/diheme cytochrome c family protein